MEKSLKYWIALFLLVFIPACGGGGGSSSGGGGQATGYSGNEPRIILEAEDGSGAGQKMPRSNASGQTTVLLNSNETRTVSFTVKPGSTAANYNIRIRYSNDNFGPTETVSLSFDGNTVGQFSSQSTGTFGQGWNSFTESSNMGPVTLSPGKDRKSVV
jgi:hypothetical protein